MLLNSAIALSDSFKTYVKVKQAVTDHDAQFKSIKRETCPELKPNEIQKYFNADMIDHIKVRIKHPHSNGKVGKLVGTFYLLKLCL